MSGGWLTDFLIEVAGPKSIPDIAWTRKWDSVYPQPRQQKLIPTMWQIIKSVPLFLRYIVYYLKKRMQGVKPLMDYVHPIQSKHQRGIPLGGIGGGTINFSYLGGFGNFQMRPGMYEEEKIVDAWQFILFVKNQATGSVYYQVLNPRGAPPNGTLSKWKWEFPKKDGEFRALYPRAWLLFDIPVQKLKLVCRIINPVLPNDYKVSCIPGCAFEWSIENYGEEALNVSMIMTCKSGTGSSEDKTSKVSCSFFKWNVGESPIRGIQVNHTIHGMEARYCISSSDSTTSSISACTYFNPCGDGSDLWDALSPNGEFEANFGKRLRATDCAIGELGAALCVRSTLLPKHCKRIPFSLCWDMPCIEFHDNIPQYRYYTTVYPDGDKAARTISCYILKNYNSIETSIADWQETILTRSDMPDWLKEALFNELYYVVDGGTLWLRWESSETLPDNDPRKTYGRFAYLEGQEYRMFNTYDVHFYASFALITHWPILQLCLQYDMRDAIESENLSEVWFLYDGSVAPRKVKNTVPHDLGDPDEKPFTMINAYPIHDVSQWKDLNLKFVLQVYRDYHFTLSKDYLNDMYPMVCVVMNHALTWDVDGDCLIENSGMPDQTYDAWVMTGTSAYCGGLWLAALHAFVKMAEVMEKTTDADDFSRILSTAKENFDIKMWNGQYYNFDCAAGDHSKTIMSDQLCGLWYLRCSGIQEMILPQEKVQKALKTIFQYNVLKYYNGTQGPVNGMKPDGSVDRYAIQSEEMWTGVAYAFSSLLIYEGFTEEGFKTAEGVYDTVYNKSGLAFATPEALHGLNSYRALSYMRPLSIWAMKLSLDHLAKAENKAD